MVRKVQKFIPPIKCRNSAPNTANNAPLNCKMLKNYHHSKCDVAAGYFHGSPGKALKTITKFYLLPRDARSRRYMSGNRTKWWLAEAGQ